MLEQIAPTPPPSNKGKFVKIKYVTMLKESVIPTFVFFCNLPQWVKEPYRRFLENKIRERWDFHGTPVSIFTRDKSRQKVVLLGTLLAESSQRRKTGILLSHGSFI